MKATVIQAKQIQERRRAVPRALLRAAGILKGKKIDGTAYQQKVRREWAARTKRG